MRRQLLGGIVLVLLLSTGLALGACDAGDGDARVPGRWHVRARKLAVSDSVFDVDGNLWLGNIRGLWKLTPGGRLFYVEIEALNNSSVSDLAFDAKGDLWIVAGATARVRFVGVFDGEQWRAVGAASRLGSDYIHTMVIDAADDKWFASAYISQFEHRTLRTE